MKTNGRRAVKVRGRPRAFDREAALERAMHVFWRQGYEAASLADLTSAMGINPPSLYSAFGDKERLFLEAVARYTDDWGRWLPDSLALAPTAREGVSRLLAEAATQLTSKTHPPGCLVVVAALSASPASSRVQAQLTRRRVAAERKIKSRIDRGIREGDVPESVDSAPLAKLYMTVIQGMTIQARDGRSRARLLEMAEVAMRAWPEA
jgi:AcrR family transcriptional regulator